VPGTCKLHEQQSKHMTRSDLVEELAARFAQLTHRDAELAVKTVLDAMSDALVKGHRIEIRGFGSFSINRRPPRVGRNPRSGESVQIPEKRVPHFKPGKALREAVDAGTVSSAQVNAPKVL
jgi:integration host factor subunit beta